MQAVAIQERCLLVDFGNGGHGELYARRGSSTSRLSGYDRPESWHPRKDTDYTGCLVLDKRPAIETDGGYRWVFRGPMPSCDVQDGEREECPQPSALFASAMLEGGGSFGTMAAMQMAHKASGRPEPGPLDYVSVAEYVRGWQRHGARAGRIIDGAIVWDD